MTNAATVIKDQIGTRALYMLGAKDLVNTGNGLRFRIRGSKKATHVHVVLNGNDLYDVEFLKVRGINVKCVASVSDIYVDMLHETIESETGLYTSL